MKIFVELSLPTLRSLRLVCKRWASIIVSPDFARQYQNRPTNKARLVIGFWAHQNHHECSNCWNFDREDRQLHFCASTPMLLNHSNSAFFSPSGLRPPQKFGSRHSRDVRVAYDCVEGVISHGTKIINPSLGWEIDIPRIDSESQRVLGYDPRNFTYKLLALRGGGIGSSDGGDYQVLTVGESSDKWRSIKSESTPKLPSTNSVCIDGFVYNITCSGHTFSLVRFDVSNEKLDFFKIQDGPCDDLVRYLSDSDATGPLLLDLKGKVSLVLPLGGNFYVWILVEGPTIQSWSECSFSLPNEFRHFYSSNPCRKSANLSVDENTGEIILVGRGDYFCKYMVFSNLETNTSRSIRIMDEGSLDMEYFAIKDYKESLFGWGSHFN